ncbi:hypothetical protein EV424DRAFT_1293839, partial [Suillus variegatus]
GAWRRHLLDDPKISCSDQATTIIAELAAAHCLSSIHNLLRWLQDIGNHVQVPSVDDETLLSLVVRCRGMMGKDIHINFMIMINFMTLVCKCQSIRLKTGLHLKGIYENEVKDRPSETKVTYRTFLEWHATGSKFIAIACGGSIYALVLISGLGLRVSITSMVGTTHLHLADMLQSPPKDSPQRKLILEHIVPTITHMHLSYPFSMTSMFSHALIERFSISKDIDCTDFSASDRFFDAIIQNDLHRLPLHTVNHSELYGGLNAPTDIQPWLLEKEGIHTNHGQVIPYISQDLQQHRCIYGTISKVYGELFEWVRQLMENYLQEEFEMLMEVASVLPGNALPPVILFISLMININVRTKAHRDSGNWHLCLVIPIGHFEGGALCLLENGLV